MPLHLRFYPDPILTRPCAAIGPELFEEGAILPALPPNGAALEASDWYTLPALAQAMVEASRSFHGYAVAGPQVGVPLNVFAVARHADLPADAPEFCINPRIVSGTEVGNCAYKESCLSLPGIRAWTRCRFERFSLQYQDVTGADHTHECSGLLAIVVQHELDHLSGILFVDRLDPFERGKAVGKVNKLRR